MQTLRFLNIKVKLSHLKPAGILGFRSKRQNSTLDTQEPLGDFPSGLNGERTNCKRYFCCWRVAEQLPSTGPGSEGRLARKAWEGVPQDIFQTGQKLQTQLIHNSCKVSLAQRQNGKGNSLLKESEPAVSQQITTAGEGSFIPVWMQVNGIKV